MKEKIEQRDKLRKHIIETFAFEPCDNSEGLLVSKKLGAVLYETGGILEIDFGFSEESAVSSRVAGHIKPPRNLLSILHRTKTKIQDYLRAWFLVRDQMALKRDSTDLQEANRKEVRLYGELV